MADLLGSILGTMEKPPTMGAEERNKAKGRRISYVVFDFDLVSTKFYKI